MQKPVFFIELVVVIVVGGGEDVENSANPCRDAGIWFSTKMLRNCEWNVESGRAVVLSTSAVKNGS
jgi:hypothetical protein